jgi:RNA polymerase sigma factor (sigma-70 family)
MTGPTTILLQGCLDRLRAGDPAAREELLRHSQERLRVLAHRMLAQFKQVRRHEETGDVLQELLMRLDQTLGRVDVGTVCDYLRLAAANLRHLLVDLGRYHSTRQGLFLDSDAPRSVAPNAHARELLGEPGADPHVLAAWTEFHQRVERLPVLEREIFDLLWYHDATHEQAAQVLNISVATVKRRWVRARIRLMEAMEENHFFEK